ncbi:MAG: PIG-L family deacetylase [Bacteroidota bacterium]
MGLVVGSLSALQAQAPKRYTSSELHLGIKKLNVLGKVLYMAAHPDDENTQMIAWLANERLYETGYLALTRGDGGQNLIGPEIREGLGVIRTQELLAARRTDGGQQFFTRANDFGYSKHPDETFNIWDREQVLADAVWTIRKWQPDVIITRFSPDRAGLTHGHHTASAILAKEAYEAAADPNRFPEQLTEVDAWQVRRVFWNTSEWFYRRSGQTFDPSDKFQVDVGAYNPQLGLSYTEISALSRSMHKSQGFGSTGRRGQVNEWLALLKGDMPTDDFMEGIDASWHRIPGAEELNELLRQADESFNHEHPAAIVPLLLEARLEMLKLENSMWKVTKLGELDEIIRGCLGLYLEVVANDYSFTQGDSLTLTAELVNRSEVPVVWKAITVTTPEMRTLWNAEKEVRLGTNRRVSESQTVAITTTSAWSEPYWLEKSGTLGMYRVDDPLKIGRPENAPFLEAGFGIEVENQFISFSHLPVVYKRNDPVDGEVYRPLAYIPPVFANVLDPVLILADNNPKRVRVNLSAGTNNVSGTARIQVPEGWKATPAEIPFSFTQKGASQLVEISVTPPRNASRGELTIEMEVDGQIYNRSLQTIEYDHIPVQTMLPVAKANLNRLDIKKAGDLIGYIMGAGDEIPKNLEQIGYQVDMLEEGDVANGDLSQYDAIVLGVRAYNTVGWLKFQQPKLLEYVKQGGTMVVQYNTSFRLVTDELAPYPLTLSRDRVTVEEAEVRMLDPKHPVLRSPNKITDADFEGWVQERGLYFPNQWDDAFTPILSSNDPGETPKDGGLLVAQYGEGWYVYSGYSWFRELPAGVPGAYRLFVNLISLGK